MGTRWQQTIYSIFLILSLDNVHVLSQNVATYEPLSPALLSNEGYRIQTGIELLSPWSVPSAHGVPPELLGLSAPVQQLSTPKDAIGPQVLPMDLARLLPEVQLAGLINTNSLLPIPTVPAVKNNVVGSIPPPEVTPPATPNIFSLNLLPSIPAPSLPLPNTTPPIGIVRPIVRNQQTKTPCQIPNESLASNENVKCPASSLPQPQLITNSFIANSPCITNSQLGTLQLNFPKGLPDETNLFPKLKYITLPQQPIQINNSLVQVPLVQNQVTCEITSLNLDKEKKSSQSAEPFTQKFTGNLVSKPTMAPVQPNIIAKTTLDCNIPQVFQPIINPTSKSLNCPSKDPVTNLIDSPFVQAKVTMNPTSNGQKLSPNIRTPPCSTQSTLTQQQISNIAKNAYSPIASLQFLLPSDQKSNLAPQLPCPQNTVKCPKLLPEDLPAKIVTSQIRPASSQTLGLPPLPPSNLCLPLQTYVPQQYCHLPAQSELSLPPMIPGIQTVETDTVSSPQQQCIYPQTTVTSAALSTTSVSQDISSYKVYPPTMSIISSNYNQNPIDFIPYINFPPTSFIIPNSNPYKNDLPTETQLNSEVNAVNIQEATSSVVLPEENYGNIEITNIVSADNDVKQSPVLDVDDLLLDEVANLIVDNLINRLLADDCIIASQPLNIAIPPPAFSAPTITIVPEIPLPISCSSLTPMPVFAPYPPLLPPVFIEQPRSKSKSWLPVLLVALFNNCGNCGSNGFGCGCCNNGFQIPVPFPVTMPICDPVSPNACSKPSRNNCINSNPSINVIVVDNNDK